MNNNKKKDCRPIENISKLILFWTLSLHETALGKILLDFFFLIYLTSISQIKVILPAVIC